MNLFLYFVLGLLCLVLHLSETVLATTPHHDSVTEQQLPSSDQSRSKGHAGRRRQDKQRKISRKQLSQYAWEVLDKQNSSPQPPDEEHVSRRSQEYSSATAPNVLTIAGRGAGGPLNMKGQRRSRNIAGKTNNANPHLPPGTEASQQGPSSRKIDSFLSYCSRAPTCQKLGERPRSELTNIDTKELKKTSACEGAHRLLRVEDSDLKHYMNQSMRILSNQTRKLCSFEHESMKTILEIHDVFTYDNQDVLMALLLTPNLHGSSANQVDQWLHFVLEDEDNTDMKVVQQDMTLMLRQIDFIRAHRGLRLPSLQQHVFSSSPSFALQYNQSHVHVHTGSMNTTLQSFIDVSQLALRRKREQRVVKKGSPSGIAGISVLGHPSTYKSASKLEEQLKAIWDKLFPYLHKQTVIELQRGEADFMQSILQLMTRQSLGLELLPVHGSDGSVVFQVNYIRS